jgi:hypothetical protein
VAKRFVFMDIVSKFLIHGDAKNDERHFWE